jgi:hypothetical protein
MRCILERSRMKAASLVITGRYATFWIMELALDSFHILYVVEITFLDPISILA